MNSPSRARFSSLVPPILARRNAVGLWCAVVLTGVGTGLGAAALTALLELTGHARAAIVPPLLIVVTATLVARTIEPRSVYDARLGDDQVPARQRERESGLPQEHAG